MLISTFISNPIQAQILHPISSDSFEKNLQMQCKQFTERITETAVHHSHTDSGLITNMLCRAAQLGK